MKVSNLFSFSQNEVRDAFSHARLLARAPGVKLLQVPLDENSVEQREFGKLLIVTPRASGRACERNRIRRRIKSIFHQEGLYKKSTVSIVLIYRDAMIASFDQLKSFFVRNLL